MPSPGWTAGERSPRRTPSRSGTHPRRRRRDPGHLTVLPRRRRLGQLRALRCFSGTGHHSAGARARAFRQVTWTMSSDPRTGWVNPRPGRGATRSRSTGWPGRRRVGRTPPSGCRSAGDRVLRSSPRRRRAPPPGPRRSPGELWSRPSPRAASRRPRGRSAGTAGREDPDLHGGHAVAVEDHVAASSLDPGRAKTPPDLTQELAPQRRELLPGCCGCNHRGPSGRDACDSHLVVHDAIPPRHGGIAQAVEGQRSGPASCEGASGCEPGRSRRQTEAGLTWSALRVVDCLA
jgi:hypothetical protein